MNDILSAEILEQANLWEYIEEVKPQIEKALREHLPLAPPKIETQFNEAIEYALFPTGKLIRPVLTILGAEICGGKADEVFPASVAVEFVHCSSLIFDDLPAMDNAKFRRGKESLHEKYGEGLAILVGLALLNASYSLVFVNHVGIAERAIAAHNELVECIGSSGMVGGQSVDLALAKSKNSDDFLAKDFESESIRNLKTSALMRLALRVGATLAGADYYQLSALERFAEMLGDAYQLSDDILDLQEDSEIFDGDKTFALNAKSETARLRLKIIVEDAKQILTDNFQPCKARTLLFQLTDYLADRSF